MPQPFSKIEKLTAAPVFKIIDPTAISERPHLAVKVMHVIAIWSSVDQEFANLMSIFLKADIETVTRMLLALTSSDARKAAIDAAAKNALSEDDFSLYTAVAKAIKPCRERRNDFAHHLWAFSPALPDALLLIDPKYLTIHLAMMNQAISDSRNLGRPRLEEASQIDPSKIYVYKSDDLDREVRDALEAADFVLRLRFALSNNPAASDMRSKLLSEPKINHALQPKAS